MPVRFRSRSSICAMYCLELRLRFSDRPFLIDVGLDHPAIGQRERRLGDHGSFDALAEVGHSSSSPFSSARRAAASRPARLDSRNSIQAGAKRQHVTRVGGFQRYAAQQAFDIEHALQRPAQFFPGDKFFYAGFHRIQPPVDLIDLDGRPQHP